MKMLKIIGLTIGAMLMTSSPLYAQIVQSTGTGEIAQTVIDIFALLFLLFGTYIALDLLKLMSGGELAMSWGFFAGAVIIFGLIEVIKLAGRAEYFPVPDLLISVGYFFIALFILLGFIRQRKALN